MTELGKKLRETREQQNMSLEDLQKITKIQKRYLVGIEEGKYELMPGKFYVRAFIKQYCEAVGLNPDVIFEEYKGDIPVTQQSDEVPDRLSRVRTRKETTVHNSKVFEVLPKVLITAGIIGIAVLIWVFAGNREMAKNNEEISPKTATEVEGSEVEEPKTSPLAEEKDKNNQEKETVEKDPVEKETEDKTETVDQQEQQLTEVQKSGKKAVFQLKNASEFQMEIVSKGETWVGVKNGKGNSFYQGILKTGETKTFDFTKETEVRLNIGNTLDAEVKINGQVLAFPFNPKDKVQQLITIQYMPAVTSAPSE